VNDYRKREKMNPCEKIRPIDYCDVDRLSFFTLLFSSPKRPKPVPAPCGQEVVNGYTITFRLTALRIT
jgi:hypothetical protein